MSKKEPLIFKIGFFDVVVEKLDLDHKDSVDALGIAYKNKAIIKVDTTLKPPQQGEVLMHEILHFVYDFMSIDSQKKLDEEHVVESMGKGLSMVFRDNPHLYKILQDCFLNKKGLPL